MIFSTLCLHLCEIQAWIKLLEGHWRLGKYFAFRLQFSLPFWMHKSCGAVFLATAVFWLWYRSSFLQIQMYAFDKYNPNTFLSDYYNICPSCIFVFVQLLTSFVASSDLYWAHISRRIRHSPIHTLAHVILLQDYRIHYTNTTTENITTKILILWEHTWQAKKMSRQIT